MNRTFLILSAVFALLPAAGISASPRSQRFDSGWRFYRGDASGAESPGYVDSSWRRVDLPHDFSIEDLPRVGTPQHPALALVTGTWRFVLGDNPTWKEPGFDDSAWQTVTLPAYWSSHVKGDYTHRIGWYRRTFTIPPALRGKDIYLLLGKIDDCDETFVNGIKVGGLGEFPPNYNTAYTVSRRYLVPARLLKGDGTDVVAVRVYNGDSDGGIYEASQPPHESGPFDFDADGGTAQGYTVGGVGWYRKRFSIPAADRGLRHTITFDGVYMNAKFWLNGHLLGVHPYGYTSFSFDLTPFARPGGSNVLAVRVDSSGRTSRWYSGSGIYRHVWMTTTSPLHIAQWGVYVTTPQVSADHAVVNVRTTLENARTGPQPVVLSSRIIDDRGKLAASGQTRLSLASASSGEGLQQFTVPRPMLWSPSSPTLYRLVTDIMVDGKSIDHVETPFGIRSISFDADHGFLLNGKALKLRGGCVHHDNGPLGSSTYDRAEYRRVELLKAAGFNAIRTSHNPPSPAFLDACDRLGMMVMDEAFDCWSQGKNAQDYHLYFANWWKRDIDSMVRRDHDHPSVILWSIGNEIPEQNSPAGAAEAGLISAEVRSQDNTRPVTEATNPNGDRIDPLLSHLDVAGYNYAFGRFVGDHAKFPARVFAQTESFPTAAFDSWMTVRDHPYVVGDFVWTALDYLGEAGIGRAYYPGDSGGFTGDAWTVSGCGDLDLLGMRKPQSYYRGVLWDSGPPVAAFVDAVAAGEPGYKVSGWGWPDERPSWTWPGTEGKDRTVRVFARTPRVRLLLNGKSLGDKETTRTTHYLAAYRVAYTPGTLVAVGLSADGREQARCTLQTTGTAAQIHLSPDRNAISTDAEDLSYILVDLLDAQGRRDPNASNLVHFSLTGPGKIVAVGNANPQAQESFQQPQRKAFRGQCLVIVKATGTSGQIHLTARAPGLKSASTTITCSNLAHSFQENPGE